MALAILNNPASFVKAELKTKKLCPENVIVIRVVMLKKEKQWHDLSMGQWEVNELATGLINYYAYYEVGLLPWLMRQHISQEAWDRKTKSAYPCVGYNDKGSHVWKTHAKQMYPKDDQIISSINKRRRMNKRKKQNIWGVFATLCLWPKTLQRFKLLFITLNPQCFSAFKDN